MLQVSQLAQQLTEKLLQLQPQMVLHLPPQWCCSIGTNELTTISGLTATTYGSATQVPVLTVNAKGRVTAASQVAVAVSQVLDIQVQTIM